LQYLVLHCEHFYELAGELTVEVEFILTDGMAKVRLAEARVNCRPACRVNIDTQNAAVHNQITGQRRHSGRSRHASWLTMVLLRTPDEREHAPVEHDPDAKFPIALRRLDLLLWLVVFALSEAITLLDLRGTFATKVGASTAIHSGLRTRARAWARELYEAYPDIQGLYCGSSMNGHAPAVALNERAQRAMPKQPLFHRALNDDMLVETLQRIALRLSYGLR
jgi:hypothetical protein